MYFRWTGTESVGLKGILGVTYYCNGDNEHIYFWINSRVCKQDFDLKKQITLAVNDYIEWGQNDLSFSFEIGNLVKEINFALFAQLVNYTWTASSSLSSVTNLYDAASLTYDSVILSIIIALFAQLVWA